MPFLPPPVLVPPPSTPFNFPFDPPLPERYTVRLLQPTDRAVCLRLICHSFAYHNAVDSAYGLPASSFAPVMGLLVDHCIPHNLSFVILDTQHTPRTPPTTSPAPPTLDADDDPDALLDSPHRRLRRQPRRRLAGGLVRPPLLA